MKLLVLSLLVLFNALLDFSRYRKLAVEYQLQIPVLPNHIAIQVWLSAALSLYYLLFQTKGFTYLWTTPSQKYQTLLDRPNFKNHRESRGPLFIPHITQSLKGLSMKI